MNTFFLILFKMTGIGLSSFFGVFALLTDYRDKKTGRITRHGTIALYGIVVGGVISSVVLLIEHIEGQAESERNTNRLLALSQQNRQTLNQIERIAFRFNPVEVTVRVPFRDSTGILDGLVEIYKEFGAEQFSGGAIQELRRCGIEFFSAGEESFVVALDNTFLFGRANACHWQEVLDLSPINLPHFRFSFIDAEASSELAFFRVDAFEAYRHSAVASFQMSYDTPSSTWVWEIDDVPVRFRSSGPIALEDLVGVKLVIQEELQYLVGYDLRPDEISMASVDMDFSDGRGMFIDGRDGSLDVRDGLTFFSYDFPSQEEELIKLLQ